MTVLSIDRIVVDERTIEATVRVCDPQMMRTSAVPGVASRALELLPGLARHSCENAEGLDARREFADTETPHLLEHISAELMALSGSPRTLRGETVWDFRRDGAGVFRVRLEYDVDVVAIGALRDGVAIVEWLMAGGDTPQPDIASGVERLRASR